MSKEEFLKAKGSFVKFIHEDKNVLFLLLNASTDSYNAERVCFVALFLSGTVDTFYNMNPNTFKTLNQ